MLQYLACLSSSSSCDKLAFDVGLQEESGAGEACWWTVHPSSKQRSEGEKVRVGDDAILVSVATERYLVSSDGSDIRDSWFQQKLYASYISYRLLRHLHKRIAKSKTLAYCRGVTVTGVD